MWVRFTEVIRYGEKDINLYFVQETNDPSATSFRIYVRTEENFTFKMFKEQGNKWTVDPQNVPHWVFDVQAQLSNALEKSVNSSPVQSTTTSRISGNHRSSFG